MSTHTSLLAALTLTVTALAGCGGGSDGAAATSSEPPPAVSYHRDVAPLVAQKCASCHTDGGIAPFPLERFEDVLAMRGPILEAISTRTMPPWLAGQGCNEYEHDPSLSDEQIAMVARWIDDGAPEGEPADFQAPPEPASGMTRVDRTLAMPVDYTPQGADDYRCFLLDWPEEAMSYVTGFRANPGDATTVHHVIAFLIAPGAVAGYQGLDDAEEGPGYTCFGGPGMQDADTSWIGAWAPGSVGGDLPAGTGIEVLPGSKIALQVHYNTAHGTPGPDRTSIDLMLAPAVEKEARWQFWTDIAWVFGDGMSIPAGDADVEHSFATDPTQYVSDGKPFTIHTAALHMHTRGTQANLSILRKGGAEECLLDIPRWDFHWQLNYRLSTPTVLEPGDQLSLGCRWDNSMGTKDLAWGEGTGDEMCLGSVYITE